MKKSEQRRRVRHLGFENLEQRYLLTGDFTIDHLYDNRGNGTVEGVDLSVLVGAQSPDVLEHPNTNPIETTDVNRDGMTTPLDVLLVINELERREGDNTPLTAPTPDAVLIDTNRDGYGSSMDVLVILNRLNGGEDTTTASPQVIEAGTLISGAQQAPTDDFRNRQYARTSLTVSGTFVGEIETASWQAESHVIAGTVASEFVNNKGFDHAGTTSLSISGWGKLELEIRASTEVSYMRRFQCCGEYSETSRTATAEVDIRLTLQGAYDFQLDVSALHQDMFYSLEDTRADYSETARGEVNVQYSTDQKSQMDVAADAESTFDTLLIYSDKTVVADNYAQASLVGTTTGPGTVTLGFSAEGRHLLGYTDDGFVRDNSQRAAFDLRSDEAYVYAEASRYAESGDDQVSHRGTFVNEQNTDRQIESIAPGYSRGNPDLADAIFADRDLLLDCLVAE